MTFTTQKNSMKNLTLISASFIAALFITNQSIADDYVRKPAFKPSTDGYIKEEVIRIKKFQSTLDRETKVALPSYLQASFNLSQESLPVNFKGNSCRAIAKALIPLKPEKDAFETSSLYETRAGKIREEKLYGNVKANSLLAFVDPTNVDWRSYDPESQKMNVNISILFSQKIWDNGPDNRAIDLDAKKEYSKAYIGKTSFGDSINATSILYNVCAVAFENMDISGSSDISTSFEIAPEIARKLKGNLRALYIGKLTTPFMGEYHRYADATIIDPVQLMSGGDIVVINLEQIWLFDSKTGTILSKIQR